MSRPNNTTSPPNPKRQKVQHNTGNTSLSNVPADEFLSKISLFSGPEVVVSVGGQEISVFKNLLCYSSAYFEAALNGNFKEGRENRVTLGDEFSAESFALVVQWMFQGRITLPAEEEAAKPQRPQKPQKPIDTIDLCGEMRSSGSTQQPGSTKITNKKPQVSPDGARLKVAEENRSLKARSLSLVITRYLDFLILADYISLLGPFTSVINAIRGIITSERQALTNQHLRVVMSFPSDDHIRRLFAQAAVRPYMDFIMFPQRTPFRFMKEIFQMDGLAADVLREYTKAIMHKKPAGPKNKYEVIDPLCGETIVITVFS